MKNAFSLRFSQTFQKHYLGQSSCAAELLYLYMYRQRNSVDAATFCAFGIALMSWLQEAESACQVSLAGQTFAARGRDAMYHGGEPHPHSK